MDLEKEIISRQDNLYYQHIRSSIVGAGLKAMCISGVPIERFKYRFDFTKFIEIDTSIIGSIDEAMQLEEFLDSNRMPKIERKIYMDNFGFDEFYFSDHSLLSKDVLLSRHAELGVAGPTLFLPRHQFDYLMGFKDFL